MTTDQEGTGSDGQGRRSRRWPARLAIGALALAGAALALALAGRVTAPVGPFHATLSVRPSLSGQTVVRLAPLGTLELDTHDAPLAVEARIDELRLDAARRIARDPRTLVRVADEIAGDARRALWKLVARALAAAVVGGALGALVRRPRPLAGLLGGGLGLTLAGAGLAAAAATWHPAALSEPRYTGILTVAPRAVGDTEEIQRRFVEYRAQLVDLVGNLTALYRAGETLPTFDPGLGLVTVLHVSDIHLNPQAFDLVDEVVRRFQVDAVVDSGDITDWGTPLESNLLARIGDLPVPYVWVRGNHDSSATQAAVAGQPNAVVLDGTAAEVAGLRLFGVGDPRFTPDKSQPVGKDVEREAAAAFAPNVRAAVAASQPPPDALVVHDPRIAAGVGDTVPLVLAGHTHEPGQRRMGQTLVLVQGSTGGAGLRALQGRDPEPLTCSVIYFDPATRRALAYDLVTVSGLGGTSARIERHVLPQEGAGPAP